MTLSESIVEDAALTWFGELDYVVGHRVTFAALRRSKPQIALAHPGQMAECRTYPAVRPAIIGAMKVALPNELKIVEAFHRLYAPLFERTEADRIQSRTLAILRDMPLPRVLSGELSVAEMEKAVPA